MVLMLGIQKLTNHNKTFESNSFVWGSYTRCMSIIDDYRTYMKVRKQNQSL
jgi:hypothetical protein